MSKYSSFTDPYPSFLAYFFKKVAPAEPNQVRLLQEYSKYPELRKYIQVEKRKNGDLEGFTILDKQKLVAERAKLNLSAFKHP
jgi:hypothetical protein